MFDELLNQHFNLDKIQIKDKIIQGGGGSSSLINYINLLIGIILFVIGMVCMFYEKFWKTTQAYIIEVDKDNMLIGYEVNGKQFSKIISTCGKNNYKQEDKIKIFYDKSDPNIIKINMFNHKIIGTVIIMIAMYIILSQYLA